MYVGEYLKTRADDPLLIMATSGEVVTYRQFEDRANQMAHLYRAQGLKRLDHVSLLFENNPRMLECEGGAERSGLYYTCINSYLAARRGGVHHQRQRVPHRGDVGGEA